MAFVNNAEGPRKRLPSWFSSVTAAAVAAVCVVVTAHVSWLRKPDKLPLPYSMANAVPFFTYVLDLAELYLWCSTERKKENKKYDPLSFFYCLSVDCCCGQNGPSHCMELKRRDSQAKLLQL